LLLLNRVSTKHGVSWIRGIAFTLGVGIVFYAVYLTILPCAKVEWGYTNGEDFKAAVDYSVRNFINFIAIFRDFTFLHDGCPNMWSSIVDFVARIFIAYGIYQTIQAFRKYGKG
jgi:hypothetical protein